VTLATVPAQSAPPVSRNASTALAVWALAWRELVRFFRQRTRVVGAVGQPVIFWVLFGAGLRTSFKPPAWAPADMSYQEYFLPGIAALIVLFTAIFSTISVIEDRREGFLQGVLVAPVPRLSIVLGKLAGGTVLALMQAALFLAVGPLLTWVGLAPSMHLAVTLAIVLKAFGFLVLLAFSLTALGYCIAWPMDSTQGFHAIMSVFLMPMWLLSGAFFPAGAGWIGWIIRLNPLTYGVAGLRRSLYPPGTFGEGLPAMWLCVVVSVGFAMVCVAIAVWMTNRRRITAS
jgi:ABC-2 type transport system permease protein